MDKMVEYLAFTLGHQWNPLLRKRFVNYGPTDWNHLKITDDDGQALVASFQGMMGVDHEEAVQAAHGRGPEYDGLIHEGTMRTLMVERCGHRDYEPEDGAEPSILAAGSGSWRTGCSADHPDLHVVHYHVDDRGSSQKIRGWWDEASQIVKEAYAEIGLLWIEVDSPNKAQIRINWESLGGSTIGLAQLPPFRDAQNCHIGFFCKFDPKYSPNMIQIATLDAHERGHNCGSGHITNDPIMHPSIRQGWNGSFKGTRFGERLQGYFGGVPIPLDPDPGPGPGPNPDPTQGKLVIRTKNGRLSLEEVTGRSVIIPGNGVYPEQFVIKVGK